MIERAICFVQHGDVFRILPAGSTIGASVEEAEERKRVHVIGGPRSTHESFEVEFGLRVEKSLPLHVAQTDRDPEILFPLRLHPLGKRAILCLRVENKLDLVRRKLGTRPTAVRILGRGITSLAERSEEHTSEL